MKYIVYEFIDLLFGKAYLRYELKSNKELKDFLFKHQNNLKNIEIFNKSNKCEINFEVHVKEQKEGVVIIKEELKIKLDEWIRVQRLDEYSKNTIRDYKHGVEIFINFVKSDNF